MTEILQERLFPQISDFVYNLILNITSNNNQANAETKWICKQYINGKFQSLDDGIIDRVSDLLHDYKKYKSKLKPIMDYNNPEELEDAIISVNISGYKTRTEFNNAARKGTEQIYKDNDFIILKINNWIAAKKYGENTRWCISTRYDDETFKHYQDVSKDNIYFIIDRKFRNNKYACVNGVVYDEYDTVLFSMESDDLRIGDGAELQARLDEHPELSSAFVIAIPTYNQREVLDRIYNQINL